MQKRIQEEEDKQPWYERWKSCCIILVEVKKLHESKDKKAA